eukprot:CAMPEP_0204907330 /NCGR_PEP_ID=MMETSP1397-20131031/6502_1 /ASSEMBLY_ACC=CAM_ASM_000891 /TAXON_ID=49980 /ORGANISM="Climacostomum Climacostomum virens, Strain Stock W-24" /LENGTH=137 /DNA_ID=CAMNT_0052076435 /DNA_START=167 /DNA_END=576 /DNA_ORIENTATION=-
MVSRDESIFAYMFSYLSGTSDIPKSPSALKLPPIPALEQMKTEPGGEYFSLDSTQASVLADLASGLHSASGRKLNTLCPHLNRKHYARNMCNNCYHRFGRRKFASVCGHTNRKMYARGQCQGCYLRSYHKSRVLDSA